MHYSLGVRTFYTFYNPFIPITDDRSDRFSFFFLPPEWQEKVSANGSVVLAALIAFEILSLVSPWRVLKVDNWAHLGGYAAGAVSGFGLKAKLDEERRKNSSWWQNFLGGEWR